MSLNIEKLCIIGTGLIGGSLALAIRARGFTGEITGAGRTESTLNDARTLGVIDDYDTDMASAVSDADMVFISVPMGAMKQCLETISPALSEQAIVTDAGSAKQTVIDSAREALGTAFPRFVAGHPIAGTENSGVQAAFKELYEDRRVILTPEEETSADAFAQVAALWEMAGAQVSTMSASHHDAVLAGTSHLPHMLAFALVDCLNKVDDVDEIFQYAAGGFRDFTRIASSDPVMWRDICLHNSSAIIDMIDRYGTELSTIKDALEQGDGESLREIFQRAKDVRDDFCG